MHSRFPISKSTISSASPVTSPFIHWTAIALIHVPALLHFAHHCNKTELLLNSVHLSEFFCNRRPDLRRLQYEHSTPSSWPAILSQNGHPLDLYAKKFLQLGFTSVWRIICIFHGGLNAMFPIPILSLLSHSLEGHPRTAHTARGHPWDAHPLNTIVIVSINWLKIVHTCFYWCDQANCTKYKPAQSAQMHWMLIPTMDETIWEGERRNMVHRKKKNVPSNTLTRWFRRNSMLKVRLNPRGLLQKCPLRS